MQECVFHGQTVYLLPGGTQEFGESLGDTVRREVLEETGLQVCVDSLLWVREFIAHKHLEMERYGDHVVEFIYQCTAELNAVPLTGAVPDTAQIGVGWVPLEDLAGLTMWPEAVKRLLLAHHPEGADLQHGYLDDCP